MTQLFDSLWAWLVANQAVLLTILTALLPTLIVATSNHPKVQGFLKLITELLDRTSIVQHSNSQPRKMMGHFKLPGMRSLPPAGQEAAHPSLIDDFRRRICKCPTAPGLPAPSPAVISQLVKIAIVDFGGTGVDPAEVVKYAAAQQRQVNEQFALPPPVGWGIAVQYVRACKPSEVRPDEAVIGLYEHPDQPGALGYHDKTPSGMPTGHVFPKLSKADGVDWRVTASHEVLELLADPELGLAAQDQQGHFHALEVCDSVEQDSYQIDGVPLSNFQTPIWFQKPAKPAPGAKYDWLGLCKDAGEVRNGGYDQIWSEANGWSQIFGQQEPRAYRKASRTTSRSARRAVRGKKLAA